MVLGVDFVPLDVPFQRRLQTAAVLFYTVLFTVAPIAFTVLLVVLLTTPFFFVAVGYLAWIYYDVAVKKTSSRGGRRIDWIRRGRLWRYFRDYFPVRLEKTSDLDPDRNYIFGYHPHGIMGCGAFTNFATEATGFGEIFPGIRPHLLTLTPNFRYPLIRAILLWNGQCNVWSRDG